MAAPLFLLPVGLVDLVEEVDAEGDGGVSGGGPVLLIEDGAESGAEVKSLDIPR